jgi:regulator of sirC expression with transglutaminase-like and TPR domain
MTPNSEISALFSLIDDPDTEVYERVSGRILSYGTSIIPNLEHLWEVNTGTDVQTRIEILIHQLHYSQLKQEFEKWNSHTYHDLLRGATLTARYQYPDLETILISKELEKIRRDIWLEINSLFTPLEKSEIICSFIYNYYAFKGKEVAYTEPDDFFIHKLLQRKKGNTINIGILYLILSELLALPVFAIKIPKQFVLAYFQPDYSPEYFEGNPKSKIYFYIDATTGQVFSQNDMDNYFKRIGVSQVATYYKPMTNRQVIQVLLEELAHCFEEGPYHYKKKELQNLGQILNG